VVDCYGLKDGEMFDCMQEGVGCNCDVVGCYMVVGCKVGRIDEKDEGKVRVGCCCKVDLGEVGGYVSCCRCC